VTYTSDTAYFAAAGPQSFQDFDRPISSTATSVRYPNLVVSCSGSSFCDSTSFGTSNLVSSTGLSIFFTSPSVATFTFNSPIHSFGIYLAGLGTLSPGSTTFSISDSNGFFANLYTNYSGTTTSFDTPQWGQNTAFTISAAIRFLRRQRPLAWRSDSHRPSQLHEFRSARCLVT
jgi:hypothetical protein